MAVLTIFLISVGCLAVFTCASSDDVKNDLCQREAGNDENTACEKYVKCLIFISFLC